MAFGLLGGGDPFDLYGDLLNDKQRAALRNQQMGQGLLRMAGAFAEAAKPSLLPTGGIGSALGKAAGALAGNKDEALKGLVTAGQVRKMQSEAKLREQMFSPEALAEQRALMARLYGGGAPTMPPGPSTAGPSGGPNAPSAAPSAFDPSAGVPSAAPPGPPGQQSSFGDPNGGLLSLASFGGEAGAPRPFHLPGADGDGEATSGDPRGLVPYIRQQAIARGIDPDVAVRVAQSEGLDNPVGDGGKSQGAFQLYTGGGMGNEFQRATGLDPSNPRNERATINYALDNVRRTGWTPFHGAARAGIGARTGIDPGAGWAGASSRGERPGDIVLPSGGGGGQLQALQAMMQMMKGPGDTADEDGDDSLSALAQLTGGGSGGGGGPDTVIPPAEGGGGLPVQQVAALSHLNYGGTGALGNPGNPGWYGQNITSVTAPGGAKFNVNRAAAPDFEGFLKDLTAMGYTIDPKTSGGYNYRKITGGNSLSEHAYGTAIDINSNVNLYTKDGRKVTNLPPEVGDMAARHNLEWGGNWTSPVDTMHFQWRPPGAGGPPDQVVPPEGGQRLPIMQAQYSPGGGSAGGVPGMPPVPNVPGVDPQAMSQLLIMLAQRNAAAEALGMGNPYGSLLSVLQGSPAYKGMIETATRGAGLPFVGPEAAAKAAGTFPYDMAGKQYQSALDRANKEAEMLGAAKLDPAEILVDDDKGGKVIVQGTREQKVKAAYGLAVPELGIPGMSAPGAAAAGGPPTGAGSLARKPFVSEEDKLTLAQEAKLLEEKRGIADTSRQAIQSAHDTRKLIEKGIIAGGYADTRTQLLKFGQLLGLTGKNEDDLIRNTEAYISNQGKEMKAALQGLGPPISNVDLQVANRLAGGQENTIPGMLKILELREKYHRQAITDYNTMAKQAPPSRYERTVKAPPTYGAPVADGPNGPVWYNGKEWVPM